MPSYSIRVSIYTASGFYIGALVLSAIFDPALRVLHVFQGLIYVAVIVLTRRNSPWGFGAGVIIAAFWDYLLIATLVSLGISAWKSFNFVLVLQSLAGLSQVALIVACLVGFLQLRPRSREWLQFGAAGLLTVAYLVFVAVLTYPPSRETFKRLLHI